MIRFGGFFMPGAKMTTYDTNKPLGSTGPEELFDNAQNMDFALNDITKVIWKDRFGRNRKTLWGLEQDFNTQLISQQQRFDYFIQNSGYKFIGEYTSGPLTIQDYNQIIRYENEFWKLNASTTPPFTTTGNNAASWVNDLTHFVIVGDAALRQVLTSTSGAGVIGTEKGSNLDVVLQDINSGFFAEFGPQLRKLNSALLDPLVQELQITFIGDSITWGTGSTGAAASGTRDGTLSDPRNNATSPSYVNQLGRLIAGILGANTVTTFSNHSYSPSGESIREMVTDKYEFPYGSAYYVVGSGSFTDVIDTNATGPYLGARRTITVSAGASASLSFNFTGSKFSLVYSQLPSSADYELLVNGVSQGVFSTRDATAAFNTRRSHSFGFVTNGTITIRALQHSGDTGNQQLRIEALLFPKTVRIKNQGIIGTTTEQYAAYNFPAFLSRPKPYPPQNMPGFSQTFVGNGGHEYVESAEPNAILGMRYKYSFTNTGSWEITLKPAATDDRVAIYFSSTDKTCDVQVLADGVAIETFHTSSNEQGVPFGYQNSKIVTIPAGTQTVKLKTVFVPYQSSVSYLYLEGLTTFNSSSQTYPTNNNFKDGVALDDKDMFAFFQVGVNDRESNQVKSPTQIRTQLEKMLSLIPQGCSPVLMASNPAKEAGNYFMQDMVQAIRQTAEKYNVAFIDNFNLFDKYNMAYFTTDSLHPNDIGHNMIARNIIKSIRSS